MPSTLMHASDEAGRWPGRLVLIADDSLDAREVYAAYLSYAGFGVYTAPDGEAAVNIAIQVRPDIIVMDLSMPKLDGVAATQRLKKHPHTRHIPVIMLTGFALGTVEQDALRAGVDVFLTKPCLPEVLEEHVRRRLKAPGTA